MDLDGFQNSFDKLWGYANVEVAQAIMFLLTNEFVTGTTVDVDGGWLCANKTFSELRVMPTAFWQNGCMKEAKNASCLVAKICDQSGWPSNSLPQRAEAGCLDGELLVRACG
eukprot:s6059_g2.t1